MRRFGVASKGFATRKRTADEFIEAALDDKAESVVPSRPIGHGETTERGRSEPHANYPWENPELSPRVQKQYNLRLDEVTLEKLRWVGKNVTVSTHQWVVDVLKDAIETKIQEIIDNQ
jgi:hypothetical protein